MAASFNVTDTSVANLFKHKYQKMSLDLYDGDFVNKTITQIKKSHDATGDQVERPVPLGFQGGAGSGSLPSANRGNYQKAIFTTKSVYTVCDVDRRTIKLSKDEGAFVDALKENVKRTVIKFNWNASRILYNDGTGALGTLTSASLVSGVTYDCIVTAATWKLANWEVRDFVNFGSTDDDFEITAITPSTRTIRVVRLGGSTVPTAADIAYLQGSKDNDPEGLKGVVDANSGSKYSITIQYRWQAPSQIAAASAGITVDLMNQAMLDIEAVTGEPPNAIVTSFVQMRKMMNQLEDQKRYIQTKEMKSRYGNYSVEGLQYMSTNGPITFYAERFCEDDRMYFLNTDHIESCHAPDMGWADDEGFVFLRKAGSDQYEARYAAYYQNYIPPVMHGGITGLAT